eukprot:139974-Chlamydomonas_euryale.AAC.4
MAVQHWARASPAPPPHPRLGIHTHLHARVGVVLVAVQLWHERRDVRRQLRARKPRNPGEAKCGAAPRVECLAVVREVHELVDEVGLAEVGRQGAQLLIRAEAAAAARRRRGRRRRRGVGRLGGRTAKRALLKDLGVTGELDGLLSLSATLRGTALRTPRRWLARFRRSIGWLTDQPLIEEGFSAATQPKRRCSKGGGEAGQPRFGVEQLGRCTRLMRDAGVGCKWGQSACSSVSS